MGRQPLACYVLLPAADPAGPRPVRGCGARAGPGGRRPGGRETGPRHGAAAAHRASSVN